MKKIKILIPAFIVLVAAVLAIGAWAYVSGLWIPNYPSLKKFPVRGMDISHHQGAINWQELKSAKMDFVYIKATEGEDLVDHMFLKNWQASREAGIRRGAYHFFILKTAGAKQASNFISVVPKEKDALPPAIDLEFGGNAKNRPSVREFQDQLSEFMRMLREFYKQEPVVYTTYEFKRGYLKDYPVRNLWIREVFTAPRLPDSSWTFWQFSGRGKVPGITGFCDLDVFSGSPGSFESFIKTKM